MHSNPNFRWHFNTLTNTPALFYPSTVYTQGLTVYVEWKSFTGNFQSTPRALVHVIKQVGPTPEDYEYVSNQTIMLTPTSPIQSITFQDNAYGLKLEVLNSGLYIIRIKSAKFGTSYRKIIINK